MPKVVSLASARRAAALAEPGLTGAQKFQLVETANTWPKLPPLGRQLAICLVSFLRQHAVCWPSQATLCDALGCTPRSLRRAADALEAAGLWQITPGSGRTSSYYRPHLGAGLGTRRPADPDPAEQTHESGLPGLARPPNPESESINLNPGIDCDTSHPASPREKRSPSPHSDLILFEELKCRLSGLVESRLFGSLRSCPSDKIRISNLLLTSGAASLAELVAQIAASPYLLGLTYPAEQPIDMAWLAARDHLTRTLTGCYATKFNPPQRLDRTAWLAAIDAVLWTARSEAEVCMVFDAIASARPGWLDDGALENLHQSATFRLEQIDNERLQRAWAAGFNGDEYDIVLATQEPGVNTAHAIRISAARRRLAEIGFVLPE